MGGGCDWLSKRRSPHLCKACAFPLSLLDATGRVWKVTQNGYLSRKRIYPAARHECKIITAKKTLPHLRPRYGLARTSLTARVKRAPDRKAPLINYYDNNEHFSCRKN
jgi:hypothetical protein